MRKATKKQKAPARGPSADGDAVKFAADTSQFSLPWSDCQANEQLSVERRLRFARLAQDLGTFYYSQVLEVIDRPDPVFNQPFGRFALCVKLVEDLLEGVRL